MVTKKKVVLPNAYDTKESLVLGFLAEAFNLPVLEPGEVLEMRIVKDTTAYCIELCNKTSDISDEWVFFNALPDEGKKLAIESLADVAIVWAGVSCSEECEDHELTWEEFYKGHLHQICRGFEVKFPLGSTIDEINRIVDETVWII